VCVLVLFLSVVVSLFNRQPPCPTIAHLRAAIPSGVYRGSLAILPYTTTSSGAQCLTQCSPITVPSTLTFVSSTLRIDISSGRSPQGCTLNAQVRLCVRACACACVREWCVCVCVCLCVCVCEWCVCVCV
jgi:hypothetical protein